MKLNLRCRWGFDRWYHLHDISKTYCSDKLFSTFSSRLPDRKRKDIDQILKKYGLEEYDPYQLLKASGARLPIDNLQFVDPILDISTAFERDFYMAGTRHYLGCKGTDCKQSMEIVRGDELFLEKESDNLHDEYAVKIQTKDREKVGYIPRYYSHAFTRILNENREISCHVKFVDKSKHCSECVMLHVCVAET